MLKQKIPLRSHRNVKGKSVLVDYNDSNYRLLPLDETIQSTEINLLPDKLRQLVELHSIQLVTHTTEIKYDDLSADDVLRRVLPSNITVPTSFEQVGHIAHINLLDTQLPYKFLIGQVLLDKTPTLRTVVNKIHSIETKFREFPMELLCGDDDYDVEVRQHGCTFRFNYKNVYWNSRLQTEHFRLCAMFQKNDVLYDVMAGVGPFAIPAAKQGVHAVKANDLNTHSYDALLHNVQLNKVDKIVECFNMDGRDFIIHAITQYMNPDSPLHIRLLPISDKEGGNEKGCQNHRQHHFVMNLPSLAITFLDAFFVLDSLPAIHAPLIHVYLFSFASDPITDARNQVERALHPRILSDENIRAVFDVRNVSPHKEMMCVSFLFPNTNGQTQQSTTASSSPTIKRQKVN
jgi:tRNA (guanine37-N1)-methyltransferase